MRNTLALGYTALVISQLCFGANVTVTKYLAMNMPIFVMITWRFLLCSIGLGLILVLSKTPLVSPKHPTQRMTAYDWKMSFLQGLSAGLLFNAIFLWGLQNTTATAAGIISSTLPALIAFLAVWLLKEHLNKAKIVALVLAMLGILIINLDHLDPNSVNTAHSIFGDILIFVAMLPEAWYSILCRKQSNRITPLGAAFLTNVFATLMLLPCAFFTGSLDPMAYSMDQIGFVLLLAITSLVFYWGWSYGLSMVAASTAGIFGGLLPVATTITAILFLGEALNWFDSIGMVLVVLSIVIGTGFKWGRTALQAHSQRLK